MTRLTASALVIAGAVLTTPALTPSAAVRAETAAAYAADRYVTLPAGTALRVRVNRGFGSDISRVEDPVSATLVQPVVREGRTVLPRGSAVNGWVTSAVRPGKVKGRGRVAVRFTRLVPAGDSARYDIATRPWVAVAPATKKKDALTIGLPAAGGAAIGALIDGKKGAGIGALAGGGAGTAVVLTTRGKDVRVNRGATLLVRLSEPLTVRVDGGRG